MSQHRAHLTYQSKGAVISTDKVYRYRLWRIWDDTKDKVLFIMLNPSTADYDVDDPTIRRCVGFAKSWGFGGVYVGNITAFRSTDPKKLNQDSFATGTENLLHIMDMVKDCTTVVCAWGNGPVLKKLTKGSGIAVERACGVFILKQKGKRICVIDRAKDGTPKHPLYLKKDLQLKDYFGD